MLVQRATLTGVKFLFLCTYLVRRANSDCEKQVNAFTLQVKNVILCQVVKNIENYTVGLKILCRSMCLHIGGSFTISGEAVMRGHSNTSLKRMLQLREFMKDSFLYKLFHDMLLHID